MRISPLSPDASWGNISTPITQPHHWCSLLRSSLLRIISTFINAIDDRSRVDRDGLRSPSENLNLVAQLRRFFGLTQHLPPDLSPPPPTSPFPISSPSEGVAHPMHSIRLSVQSCTVHFIGACLLCRSLLLFGSLAVLAACFSQLPSLVW